MSVSVLGFLATLFTFVVGVAAVTNAVRSNKIKHGEIKEEEAKTSYEGATV